MFHLALRQTEGLIGSVMTLLGLDVAVPDHSTLSRRAETLVLLRPRAGRDGGPCTCWWTAHPLKLCGAGEWLREKHGTKVRRVWRTLHIGTDTDTGEIVAATLTDSSTCDASQVAPLLDQVIGPLASVTADNAYDRDCVYDEIANRQPDTAVIVPPRSGAVPSIRVNTEPTQRDRTIHLLAERDRMGWQTASGYNWRALVEAEMSRFKRVIGDGLRSRTDRRRTTEVANAVRVLSRMLDLGRPEYVRTA